MSAMHPHTVRVARVPVHPGEILADAIKERGTTKYAVYKHTGIPQSALSGIVAGKRAITARTALLLARFFGTSAEFWMGLQTAYDLDMAQAEMGDELAKARPLAAVEGT